MTLYMTHRPLTIHRSNPLLLASTLLVAVGCILLTSCSAASSAPGNVDEAVPRRASLSGTTVCLPHRDTSGPQTMECAFGLRTDDGSHYALDLTVLSSDVLMDAPTNARVTLEGTLVPLQDIDERTWKVYDIVGQMRVTSVHKEG